MASCWKCGENCLDGQVECGKCANVNVTYTPPIQARKVDWTKVHSIDDFKRIMAVFGMQVVAGSPAEEALREFLED